jgi:hypothetical protein
MDQQPFDNIIPLPEGGPWEFVRLRDGLAAPQRFIAEMQGLRLEIEVLDSGQGRVIALEVRAPDAGRIASDDLRRLPISRLTRQAVAGAAQHVKAGKVAPRTLLAAMINKSRPQAEADAAFYRQFTDHARSPRQGSPLTDENLRQVADIYRAADKRGDPPTQKVADVMHVARSTAARWVGKARKQGFLGPALKGRSGEADA